MTREYWDHMVSVTIWLILTIVISAGNCGVWWAIRTVCGGNVRWWEYVLLLSLVTLPAAHHGYRSRAYVDRFGLRREL